MFSLGDGGQGAGPGVPVHRAAVVVELPAATDRDGAVVGLVVLGEDTDDEPAVRTVAHFEVLKSGTEGAAIGRAVARLAMKLPPSREPAVVRVGVSAVGHHFAESAVIPAFGRELEAIGRAAKRAGDEVGWRRVRRVLAPRTFAVDLGAAQRAADETVPMWKRISLVHAALELGTLRIPEERVLAGEFRKALKAYNPLPGAQEGGDRLTDRKFEPLVIAATAAFAATLVRPLRLFVPQGGKGRVPPGYVESPTGGFSGTLPDLVGVAGVEGDGEVWRGLAPLVARLGEELWRGPGGRSGTAASGVFDRASAM